MPLVDGVEPGPGIALGTAAFGAQTAVGWILTRSLDHYDRVSLVALAQQNGVTAVVLALSLEPAFPRTVAIVAPAVVTVNTLRFLANRLRNGRPPPPHVERVENASPAPGPQARIRARDRAACADDKRKHILWTPGP
ncbi:hypothetical protein [Streptomyces beigongshangae]|uniref:hypothetical protein n=1 Tax=Streptomyces beigongshangae TaxID=2841597 RepID=UPI001C861591|nr:hypothetical protein [Streptomyces sp. REN17]